RGGSRQPALDEPRDVGDRGGHGIRIRARKELLMARTIAVLGAGKIGRMVSHMLGHCGDYQVRVGDVYLDAAKRATKDVPNTQPFKVDFDDERSLEPILSGATAVL